MSNEINLYSLLNMIRDALVEEEFPEVCDVIDEKLGAYDLPVKEAPRIASRIMECDKPKRFPQELLDFVKGLYEIAIKGQEDTRKEMLEQLPEGEWGFE